ncbi:MAG: hypothetical protein RJA22_2186 [Verrucomicrobiota bacterium]|jgi:hypothetical protein
MPEPASSRPVLVRDTTPPPELLRSLGHLVRGLSVLFWGLPLTLVASVLTANGDLGQSLGVLPPVAGTGFLLWGLHLLGAFQPQERPWRQALDRAFLIALVNLGLAPFLFWWSRVPSHPFLSGIAQALALTGLLFLLALNPLLVRLTAMLPDEALRQETRLFTSFNRTLLGLILVLVCAWLAAVRVEPGLPERLFGWLLQATPLGHAGNLILFLEQSRHFLLLFLILLPLAMTMALLWKIKEVILASVFGHGH